MDLEAAQQLLPDLDLIGLTPLDGGAVHSNYALRTSDGRDLVLKLYREELSWKLDKELYLLGLVRDRVRVPEVVHSSPGVLVMTKLPGVPLRFSEEDPVAVSRQLGAVLRELHTITFEGFGYVETRVNDPVASNLEFMRRRIETKLRNLDSPLRDSLARHFAAHEHAFAGCEQAVLCHNDAHDANVLVADGRITGLLDWENAVAADPLLDLAKAHVFASRRSDETLAALVEGYGPLRPGWREAFDLYVIDHLVELWLWFLHLDVEDPIAGLAADLEGMLDA